MKSLAMMCLFGVLTAAAAVRVCPQRAAAEVSPFALADRFGERDERTFFVFSTDFAKYILRHDGMGEITSQGGLRKVFVVKAGAKERLERVYWFEYEGDLLLLYQAGDSGYLVRMNQKSRKMRTIGPFAGDFEPPLLHDRRLVFSDGRVVTLD